MSKAFAFLRFLHLQPNNSDEERAALSNERKFALSPVIVCVHPTIHLRIVNIPESIKLGGSVSSALPREKGNN